MPCPTCTHPPTCKCEKCEGNCYCHAYPKDNKFELISVGGRKQVAQVSGSRGFILTRNAILKAYRITKLLGWIERPPVEINHPVG